VKEVSPSDVIAYFTGREDSSTEKEISKEGKSSSEFTENEFKEGEDPFTC
jgi:hypothetical protein